MILVVLNFCHFKTGNICKVIHKMINYSAYLIKNRLISNYNQQTSKKRIFCPCFAELW